MPLRTLKLAPGVNVQETPTLNTSQWSTCQLIRFKDGLAQKLGGWQRLTSKTIVGLGRGIHIWADLAGNPYLAIGTDQRLEIFAGGEIFDITPLRATHNVTPDFSTVITTPTVTVKDIGHGAAPGDWINIFVPVSVGGLILQGFYLVQTVIDADNYTITAASPATATVNHGGAVPTFTTTGASPNVTVTLANHGLVATNFFTVEVATTVSTITIAVGDYEVNAPVSTNTFVIVPGGIAGGGATVAENGGNARIEYLIPTGPSSTIFLGGYGIGDYGAGDYGLANSADLVDPLREWFLDNFGQDLVGNYNGSPIFVWTPPPALGNLAIAINTTNFPGALDPPTEVASSFVAMPQQMIVALGADVPMGPFDPNLVRWCDVDDFTDWRASSLNQAGSFRIPTGSRIVGGVQGQQFGLIWTDIDLWLMQYLQPPLVFGFQKVGGNGSDLLAPRAAGLYRSAAYWASRDNFLSFDGTSVRVLPCPVWDKFFGNLNFQQVLKVFCAVNSFFNEIWWFYPSANSDEVDSYVKVNVVDDAWDFGTLDRTCWQDENVIGGPIGSDTSGLLQEHEVGFDADGMPMLCSIQSGYQAISEGTLFEFIERIIPDFVVTGSSPTVQISVALQDYPTDTPQIYGPYDVTTDTTYVIVRARNREAALKVSSNQLGVFWRVGAIRFLTAPAGRR